jgi:LacI family transcriptional regulator, galactose operon repressor
MRGRMLQVALLVGTDNDYDRKIISGVSRSTLDSHFRRVVDRTSHDEIERVRLNIARSLLENTDLPLRIIAAKSGYRNEQYLCKVLRRALGRTPGQHRQATSLPERSPKLGP